MKPGRPAHLPTRYVLTIPAVNLAVATAAAQANGWMLIEATPLDETAHYSAGWMDVLICTSCRTCHEVMRAIPGAQWDITGKRAPTVVGAPATLLNDRSRIAA